MPIKGLSEKRQLPRLGKIKLGVMVQSGSGSTHPRATEYFVVPEAVAKVYGERPTSLPVMFHSDDPEAIFPQSYKMYRSAGLWCKGDGETAKRWNDKGELVPVQCPCSFLDAEGSESCGPEATLLFFLPEVKGIGVWTITTGNKSSIVTLNSGFELYSRMFGGLRGIPFQLILEPRPTERYDAKKHGMVKTVIQSMRLTTERTLMEVMDWRRAIGSHVEPLMLMAGDEDRAEDRHVDESGPIAASAVGTPEGSSVEKSDTTPADTPAAPLPLLGAEHVEATVTILQADLVVAPSTASAAAFPAGEQAKWKLPEATSPEAWDRPEIITLLYAGAAHLGFNHEEYSTYLGLKYAHVRDIPFGIPVDKRIEQGQMLYKALEDLAYRPKAIAHLKKVIAKSDKG